MKREELAKILLEAMKRLDPNAREDEANSALDALCKIREPEIRVPKLDDRLEMTRFDGKEWKGGAYNIKPGNITLNMQNLLTVVASGVLTIGGAVTAPWTIPFAGLVLWGSIYSGIRCEISESDAVVLWVMWKLKDDNNCVAHSKVLPNVNTELRDAGRQEMQPQQLDEAIENLTSLRCIEKAKNAPERWWLRERVSVKYT